MNASGRKKKKQNTHCHKATNKKKKGVWFSVKFFLFVLTWDGTWLNLKWTWTQHNTTQAEEEAQEQKHKMSHEVSQIHHQKQSLGKYKYK